MRTSTCLASLQCFKTWLPSKATLLSAVGWDVQPCDRRKLCWSRCENFQQRNLSMCKRWRLESMSSAFGSHAAVGSRSRSSLSYGTAKFISTKQSLAFGFRTSQAAFLSSHRTRRIRVGCHRLWYELKSLWGRCLAGGDIFVWTNARTAFATKHRKS